MTKIILVEPDVSKRKIKNIGNDGTIIGYKSGMYNPNLTLEELCLIRQMIWENKGNIEIINFLHSWLFYGETPKEPILFSDLIAAFDTGIEVSFQEKE